MRVLFLLLLSLPAFAGVQISDTIQTPFSGVPFIGKITISGPQMTTAAGQTVARWQNDYQVVNGVFSVTLEPNDTATPVGTSYSARYTPTPAQRGAAWTETWVVPTSASPLKINQVRVLTIPAPGLVILPQQIAAGGATLGQCLGWSGSAWEPVDCAGTSVTSFNGRNGTVVAESGDYSFGQISGIAGYGQLPALSYSVAFSAQTYSAGTVSVTNGSTAITGIGTEWTPEMTGMLFIPRPMYENCDVAYRFTYISATSGTLDAVYGCQTTASISYQLSETISVPGATHQLGTADMTVQCFDASTPRNKLTDFAYVFGGPSIDPTSYDVKITFWQTQAGRCVMHR